MIKITNTFSLSFLRLSFKPITLRFRFEAGTSRGILHEKISYFLFLNNDSNLLGLGECAPLRGLSIDDIPGFNIRLEKICNEFNSLGLVEIPREIEQFVNGLIPNELPSIHFGLETLLHDAANGGHRIIFDNDFVKGNRMLPINGLIWMGSHDFMASQIEQKLSEGYTTLKLKVGSSDFKGEVALIKSIRSRFPKEKIAIRLDANGAFSPKEAQEKLHALAAYDIHSIEQPVRQGQPLVMREVVKASPIPIALDEELIGRFTKEEKEMLLSLIKPHFIILKPTLLGGFRQCREWISLAESKNIGWWITSALESNIGLNAIAQFTAEFANELPQGLGTGQLFHNNIPAPLFIRNGLLGYNVKKNHWGQVG